MPDKSKVQAISKNYKWVLFGIILPKERLAFSARHERQITEG